MKEEEEEDALSWGKANSSQEQYVEKGLKSSFSGALIGWWCDFHLLDGSRVDRGGRGEAVVGRLLKMADSR